MQEQLRIATTPAPPPPPEPYKIGSLPKLNWGWNFGPEARSPNRDFYFHVGGRVQWDNVWLNSNDQAAALENVGVNNDAFQQGDVLSAAASAHRRVDVRNRRLVRGNRLRSSDPGTGSRRLPRRKSRMVFRTALALASPRRRAA